MTTQVHHGSKFRAGKVVIGPRAIGDSFYRIVSTQDRSGRIEAYDPQSRSWSAAPESVTFNDVWRAQPVSQFALDRACAFPDGADEDDSVMDDIEAQVDGAEREAQLEAVH